MTFKRWWELHNPMPGIKEGLYIWIETVLDFPDKNPFKMLMASSQIITAMQNRDVDAFRHCFWNVTDRIRNSLTFAEVPLICGAAECNAVEIERYLLGMGANPDEKMGKLPLLLYHLYFHDEKTSEIVHDLLVHGANPNVADRTGDTPLICAVYNGDVDSVRWLINFDADLNAQNKEGSTALMLAIDRKNFEITRHLLHAGARTDIADKTGWTAVDCQKYATAEIQSLFQPRLVTKHRPARSSEPRGKTRD